MDTLAISKTLQEASMPASQADAVASALRVTVEEGTATRADLRELEARIDQKFGEQKAALLTWFIGTQIALAALIVALIKL